MAKKQRNLMTVERRRQATQSPPLTPVLIDGFDRSRVYTREEICYRFGYHLAAAPKGSKRDTGRNLNRFFREHFLNRGLEALPVGKTYLVSGERLWLLVTTSSKAFVD
jgi:hypothetical protein